MHTCTKKAPYSSSNTLTLHKLHTSHASHRPCSCQTATAIVLTFQSTNTEQRRHSCIGIACKIHTSRQPVPDGNNVHQTKPPWFYISCNPLHPLSHTITIQLGCATWPQLATQRNQPSLQWHSSSAGTSQPPHSYPPADSDTCQEMVSCPATLQQKMKHPQCVRHG